MLPSIAASGAVIPNNTPAYVKTAANLGPEIAASTIEVSIWLTPRNRPELDALARGLYDPSSPVYRHWLTSGDVTARFAPTEADTASVKQFFTSNGMHILSTGPHNFYVRARGTIADVESAFHVHLNRYQVGTDVFRANSTDPVIDAAFADRVLAVSGLDNNTVHQSVVNAPGPQSPSGSSFENAAASGPRLAADTSAFEKVCFAGPKVESRNTGGGYPKATYAGNSYVSGEAGCGYSPEDVQEAYGLSELYAEGHDGAGQTIVLIESCGSPTIQEDANTFSAQFHLPPLTASNFQTINYPGPSTCSGEYPQINADVEWAHAIAPGANIVMVVAPTGLLDDLDAAIFYAANQQLGNIISGSYFVPEFFTGQSEAEKENLILEIAAVMGIGGNFPSGDLVATFLPPVNMPAAAPYATAVGGITLALNARGGIAFQTVWENHFSVLDNAGTIYDPAAHVGNFTGYLGGVTGGPSQIFSKPPFQKGVAGSYRQTPDIAWLSDPFTGPLIVVSQPTQWPLQVWYPAGGTGVATSMFSALWAIANQVSGVPLGQAAPYLYAMPPSTITDIVPLTSSHDVTATVQTSSTQSQHFDPADTLLIEPDLFGPFYSAIWDYYPSVENTVWVLSFGQDYQNKAGVGWDATTGVGTPKPKAFIDWFASNNNK